MVELAAPEEGEAATCTIWRAMAVLQALAGEIGIGREQDVNANTPSADHGEVPPSAAPAPMSWARLLKRVFEIHMENSLPCGGTLTIIAAIEDHPVIARILTHLGLPARAPPRSPARPFDRLQRA